MAEMAVTCYSLHKMFFHFAATW